MSHQRHRLWITAKALNIPSNPPQGQSLILESEVSWTILVARTEESENIQSILDSDQNNVRVHKVIGSEGDWVGVAITKSSAVQINDNR